MHCFRIDAIADPQSLPRITGFFAQRAITPTSLQMETLDDHLLIEVRVGGVQPRQADAIRSKIGEMFAVIEVELVVEIAAAV